MLKNILFLFIPYMCVENIKKRRKKLGNGVEGNSLENLLLLQQTLQTTYLSFTLLFSLEY